MKQMHDLIVRNLSKSYSGNAVLSDLSLTLSAGKSYCLMAPSGGGKTTFFRILMGLETPDSGSIDGLHEYKLSAVFQEDRLLEGFTAMENIRFVTGRRYTDGELSSAVLRLLPEDSLKKPVCEFSGGMKRRTAILRALLAPSDMIIMDEPFTGLDADTKMTVIDMIKEYTNGKLFLFSSHDPKDAELLNAEVIQL